MSLFVGNISRNLRAEDLEEEFDKIGACTVNFKGSFAFVEYKDERDGEDAINELNGKELGGQKISIEWSKKSGKFDPKSSHSGRGRSRRDDRGGSDKRNSGCYNCGKPGHFARDCRAKKRSRSRSYEQLKFQFIVLRNRRRDNYRGGNRRDSRSPRRDSRSPRRDSPRRDSPRRDDRRRKSRSNSYPRKVKLWLFNYFSKQMIEELEKVAEATPPHKTKELGTQEKAFLMAEIIVNEQYDGQDLTLLINFWNAKLNFTKVFWGQSNDKSQERLRGQDPWASRLNQEADSLKNRLQQVEESKKALQNNRQFREAQEKYEQQIQTLESDKVSLMKRLNMVLSELEKATHEKAEINQKVIEQERMADDLKKKLDEVSSLKNVVNRNLQEDLRYERDLNEKLKEELARFDKEKEQLLAKLKDQESLTNEIQRETNAINANLQRKSEELKRLEREHEGNLIRLRDLNNMLDSLRSQEMHSKNEKRRLEDELDDLTRERNDLIRRMNELSDRYEDYVSTMNRERIEIMRANKNHVKLLTSKLLFQILNEAIFKRRKNALQEIKACSQQIYKMESKMQKFGRIMFNYFVDRKRHYLRVWYRNSMNFVHENYKKLNLIDFNVNKKRKIKFYYKWRQAFLQRRRNYDSKVDALKVMRTLLNSKQDLCLRSYLCKWRDFVELRQYQQDFMFSVMNRKRQRNLRLGFVKWLAITKKQQMDERYENMSELVTNLWFKQRVFLALRQACLESKSENSMIKFKAWKNWCETARKKKYFERKKALVDRLMGTRVERLMKQCFDAIKFSNMQDHYEETKKRLEEEIPVREELERKRDTLIKTNKTRDKYNLFRQACIRYADLKYRALQVWKENVQYHNHTMQRIKLRLIELHKRSLSASFFKWKEACDKKQIIEMVSFTEDLINENQELKNSLQAQLKEREKLADCTGRQQGLKLERIRNMLNRNLMRAKFEVWARNAFFIMNLEDAVWKSSKTILKRKLRNAFNKYKKKVGEVKRLEYIANKVDWFENVRNNKAIDQYWDQWKNYIKVRKSAKKFLERSIKGVDKLIKNDAFSTWKNAMYAQRKMVYMTNIEELERRQEEHESQIKELNHQIQVNDCTSKHLESKLQTQAHRIMANFISRMIYSSQARGFYTWLDVLKDHKTKKRFLRTTMLYWIKNSEAKAFRQWAENTLKSKEAELATKLQAREQERKALQRQKEEEERAQGNEIDKLQKDLNEAISLKDQLQANYEKALETHISRIQNNVYIDKRQNIFSVWANFIKREKNAINVIGAIARKQLRMEVFSRIRLVARERYLEQNAEKIMTNFARMFKYGLVKKAFSKWRVKTYGEVVKEMNLKKEELEQTRIRQENEMNQMQMQKQNKAVKILKQRRQREIANAWIQMAKVLKALRVKQEILNQNLRYLQLRYATKKWNRRTKVTGYLRRRDDQVVRKYQLKSAKKCYDAWKERTRISKLLCTRVTKFVKRMQYVDLADGFSQIVHFTRSFEERLKERKDHGQQSIQKILSRLLKNKIADVFLTLKMRSLKKNFKEEYFLRMVKHVYLYRMKHFFNKWKHNSDRIALAENINTEGDVVLERNEMRRNVKALRDFLLKQGYSEEEIQKYLDEKTNQQKGNMHRAIVSLFFKKSDFNIMPKAYNQWKRWVQQRKLTRQWAQYCVNAMNHPLFWAFRKWKMQEIDAQEKLKNVSKRELIEKIISDEMAIGSAQSRLERMDEALENLNIQRDNLLQHYISGQKLAIALGKNNHTRSMYRAFIRWKKFTKDCEQQILAEQLERTNQMINDLMTHVSKLENINRNLAVENEELRLAALDGIEIAKAVQELTKEREMLSQDLQDRATTIKKLIEDNNNLSLRLSIAQKEAEQLEQLNQQSYLAPPEKDRYY